MTSFYTLFSFFILQTIIITLSIAQLAPSETRILLQLQQQLEYPPVLQAWNNWTSFCYLQSSASLTVVCSGNHITELTVVGNKTYPSTLSESFSIDSFFTILTKLSNLKVLSLVSLGLWGTLPAKIDRLDALQILNISSNSISSKIPPEVNSMINLLSLVLANNLLNGSVPLLTKLAALKELDLSHNRLGPGFPSLENFKQLKHLNLSSNQFTGSVPSTWFSLPSIQYFNVAGNKLSGTLSTNISCSGRLEFVDISQNYLFGKLPLCLQSNSSNRAIYYSWNCLSAGNLKFQHPDAFCHKKALAVNPAIQNKQDKHKESINKWAIILTIGIIAAVVLVGLFIFVVFRRVKGKKIQKYTLQNPVSKRSSIQLSPDLPTEARHVSPMMRFGTFVLRAYHVYSLGEIEEATDNFDPSNLMGEGSQGQLYKAYLRDGSTVAMRCIRLGNRHSHQRLLQHMDVMSKLRHQHLVSVLGHCIVTQKEYSNAANTIFLLYEYVPNSTLRNHLTDQRKRNTLKWPQRIALAMGVAKGIQFLHTGITPGIFGNNIKIENILLDQNIVAKISNYNLLIPSKMGSGSPLTVVETPDKFDSPLPSGDGEKEDVYHFGAILLEIITGKPITSQNDVDIQRLQLEESIAQSQLKVRRVVDPSIHGSYAYQSLKTAAEIAITCLSEDPTQRPTVEDIIWNLQYSVQVQDGWAISCENPHRTVYSPQISMEIGL